MKEKIKEQLLELADMLQGGYTTDYNQLKRLLGIKTEGEEYIFTRWLEKFEMAGLIELWKDDRIYII